MVVRRSSVSQVALAGLPTLLEQEIEEAVWPGGFIDNELTRELLGEPNFFAAPGILPAETHREVVV